MKVTPYFRQYVGLRSSHLLQRLASTELQLFDAIGILMPSLKFQLLCLLTDPDKERKHILGERRALLLVKE